MGVEGADQGAFGVENQQLIDQQTFHHVRGLHGEGLWADVTRVGGHYFAKAGGRDVDSVLKGTSQVAIGEDAAYLAVGVVDHRGHAKTATGNFEQGCGEGGLRRQPRYLIGWPHDVANVGEKAATERAARVCASEVLRTEAARLEQRDGKCVTQGQRRCCARGWGEVERTGFFADASVEMYVGLAGECRSWFAGDRDQGCALALDQRNDGQHFFARTRVRKGDDDILGGDHAQVAVRGFSGMDEVCGGAGAGERGGDLATNVAGLADAGDDDASVTIQNALDGFDEGGVHAVGEGAYRVRLDAQDPPRDGDRVEPRGCGLVRLSHGWMKDPGKCPELRLASSRKVYQVAHLVKCMVYVRGTAALQATSPSPLVRLESVRFAYGEREILKGVDLTVARGQVVAIMGGSGCGKTTLLRLIGGQLQTGKGRVEVAGQDVSELDRADLYALRRRMGMLFQFGALFTDLSVFDNVAFPLREHTDLPPELIHDLVLMKLNAVGLRGAGGLMPSELSGGMARRVALARAVALDPMLIMYDEPFAGLDPISLGIIGQLIRKLNDALGASSIMVTHDVHESLEIVDYVYFVSDGRIVAKGTPDEIRASSDPFVHQFVSASADGPVPFHYPAGAIEDDLLGAGRRA